MAEVLLQLSEVPLSDATSESVDAQVIGLRSSERSWSPSEPNRIHNIARCCILCIQIALTILVVLVVVALAIICSPCICFCCVLVRAREGRAVFLDGTRYLKLDANARENILRAQTSNFQTQFANSFMPGLTMREIEVRLSSFRSRGESLRSSLPESLGQERRESGISERAGEGLEVLRVSLKESRIELYNYQRKARKLPSLPGRLVLNLKREHILEQTLQCLGSVPEYNLLATNLTIKFEGEQGVDAGGVARDWFDCVGRNLSSNAEQGEGHLMILPDNTLFPRPYETRFEDLYAIGRFIGLAIWFGVSIPISLGSVACKYLLDAPISTADVQRLDPDFYKFRVEPVLRPDGVTQLEEALCEPLMFVSAATDLRESKELCPGGAERRVTEESKGEFIRLLCEYHLCGDMEEQINVFLQGFWDIFPKDDLVASQLTYRELALLIGGYSNIDPFEWQSCTEVEGTSAEDLISSFWEMVYEMTQEERAKLLHFVTGSSRLPSTGFAAMSPSFTICVQNVDHDSLPHSHTCGNMLVLPYYTSKDILVTKMKIALANDEGFGFL